MNIRIFFVFVSTYFMTTIALAVKLTAGELSSELPKELHSNGQVSVIVEYNTPVSSASLKREARTQLIGKLHRSFIDSLSPEVAKGVSTHFELVPASVMSLDKNDVQKLRNNPLVKNVYPNGVRRLHLGQSKDIVLSGAAQKQFSGAGQAVAILDTGVDRNHIFFQGESGQSRVVSEACYTLGGLSGFREISSICPNRARQQIGEGAGANCTAFAFPGCAHGTHVAGIAAGNDGIANEADIIAINVFTGVRDVFRRDVCGTGVGRSCVLAFDSDIIRGLERVFSLRNTFNIAAVNMSLGGGRFFSSCDSQNPVMTNVINRLKSVGIATVISSGNDGFSNSVGFPSCISNAITVGATSDFTGDVFGRAVTKDERVFYSNVSDEVDLYAPGTLIRSSIPGNGFENFNGTSMAAPHVAGGFAIVKAASPSLTVDQIEGAFKSVGPDVVSSGVERKRLSITNALRKLGLLADLPMGALMMLLLDGEEE